MEYHNEADEDADGAPRQVGGPESEDHPLLAIDEAGRLLEPAAGDVAGRVPVRASRGGAPEERGASLVGRVTRFGTVVPEMP
jgi:hypothetical protein